MELQRRQKYVLAGRHGPYRVFVRTRQVSLEDHKYGRTALR